MRMRFLAGLVIGFSCVAKFGVAAEDDARCAGAWRTLHAAEQALQTCLASGGGCESEFTAKSDAEKATEGCSPETIPTPVETATPAPLPANSPVVPAATPLVAWTPQPTPTAPPAPRARFGERGTVELGGDVYAYSQKYVTKYDASSTLLAGKSTSSYSDIGIEPYVGYFFADGAEITGGFLFFSDAFKQAGSSSRYGDDEFDVEISGALLPGNGTDTFRVGPEVELRYDDFATHNTDAAGNHLQYRLSGPDVAVMLTAKSVVGRSGLLTADAGYHWLSTTGLVNIDGPGGSGSTSEHYSETGFFTGVGFAAWF